MNWNLDLHKSVANEQIRRAERQRLLQTENDDRRGKRARKSR
tara:strand:- start:150 stop:275 length:126 start_codon:yes stop_codon:yes gene_type:complete